MSCLDLSLSLLVSYKVRQPCHVTYGVGDGLLIRAEWRIWLWESRVDAGIRWVRFKESSPGGKLNLVGVRMQIVELMLMLGTFG